MSVQATRAMRERDFQLMQNDTATPLESGRVIALADRCEVEGLDNCATTLRGLLAEVARLRAALTQAVQNARDGCLVPPDGGSSTEAEADMCDRIAARIEALTM